MKHVIPLLSAIIFTAWPSDHPVHAQPVPSDLARLAPGSTKAVNALWGENPLAVQFRTTTNVIVADLHGPAEITMIHFAYPGRRDPVTHSLNRDVRLRIFWDGETTPSVDCPLVDFFCDPNGERDWVNTALVNVRQGFNAYFPMPFRKSARLELLYDGPLPAGRELESRMPCYSYVCYHTLKHLPSNTGYFCASWRQEELLLGQKEYVALETTGRGKFVGWNVTVRNPYLEKYPVDENEKFFIDGETQASVEFQGLEDSFGFSWGFPPTENLFPFTGYFPFHTNGGAAYRFFVQDAINFHKALKVTIGFGDTETGWKKNYSVPVNALQFSSTVYWYQIGPHPPLPEMLPVAQRAPEARRLFWPAGLPYSSSADFEAQGGKLLVACGLSSAETVCHQPGYSITLAPKIQQWVIWPGDVFYCRMAQRQFEADLNLPKGATGTLRLYIIDPDNFQGGRKETIVVGGENIGTFENFQKGRWIDVPVSAQKTAEGKLSIQVINARTGSNAVLSNILWIEK
ncbi:MAG TPA: glycoside hydrolase family 172 protein [Candidatus Acidoferrum sp.]|nr:glycoside hydrolase family 172 protein [Candidatus Acidoferrum sp.]